MRLNILFFIKKVVLLQSIHLLFNHVKVFAMKKSVKILSVSLVALLLSVGAAVNVFRSLRTESKIADLTLANIEALSASVEQTTDAACLGDGNCVLKCDICGLELKSKGKFRGVHTCSITW